jgi:hypothetical protein
MRRTFLKTFIWGLALVAIPLLVFATTTSKKINSTSGYTKTQGYFPIATLDIASFQDPASVGSYPGTIHGYPYSAPNPADPQYERILITGRLIPRATWTTTVITEPMLICTRGYSGSAAKECVPNKAVSIKYKNSYNTLTNTPNPTGTFTFTTTFTTTFTNTINGTQTYAPTAIVATTSPTLTPTFTYVPLANGVSVTSDGKLIGASAYIQSTTKASHGMLLGDSLLATYSGYSQVSDFILTTADTQLGSTITTDAWPADTIANQSATFLADTAHNTYDWIGIEIGFNDAADSAATIIGKYQTFVNLVNTHKKADCLVFLVATQHNKSGLVRMYGSEGGNARYNTLVSLNQAVMGGGSTPITAVSYRMDSHLGYLEDENGNLRTEYDPGDNIHSLDPGRKCQAQEMRKMLVQMGFFRNEPPQYQAEYFRTPIALLAPLMETATPSAHEYPRREMLDVYYDLMLTPVAANSVSLRAVETYSVDVMRSATNPTTLLAAKYGEIVQNAAGTTVLIAVGVPTYSWLQLKP